MHSALQRAWLRRGPLALFLLPLAGLFGLLAGLRRWLYASGWLHTAQLMVPVVVVGNVVAGGAGKTPVVAALVEHLQAAGLRPGVISRGHGRTASNCREVRADDQADAVGDEPLLIARRCGVPVFVAPRRVDAARALLARYPDTQVLVSDDGLQHLAMARDIEICVFDERGIGNGWLLPAGPLREPWPRRADLVLRPPAAVGLGGFALRRALAPEAVRADGARRALADFSVEPQVVAVAGIARPEAFFAMLEAAGLVLERRVALPDHHDFDAKPVALSPQDCVLCTDKDAVKLWRRAPQAWAVPLTLEIEPAFWAAFDGLLEAKLSSPDGSQTA